MNVHNTSLIFGHIALFLLAVLMAIGYFIIFRFCLSNLFYYLDRYKGKNSNNKFLKYFSEHPFMVSLIIMLICWSIYIIAYYPVILSPDPSYQIKQFFGIRTKYADYAILIDENINNDWYRDKEINDNFVYVNGHNHKNYHFDDGVKRIYADNQIG